MPVIIQSQLRQNFAKKSSKNNNNNNKGTNLMLAKLSNKMILSKKLQFVNLFTNMTFVRSFEQESN